MDLNYQAFCYSVRAKGYDEKAEIIRHVAKELGFPGIKEFAQLVGEDPERLGKYATLDRFFEDRNWGRSQRKPKMRNSKEDYIDPKINKQMIHWGCA